MIEFRRKKVEYRCSTSKYCAIVSQCRDTVILYVKYFFRYRDTMIKYRDTKEIFSGKTGQICTPFVSSGAQNTRMTAGAPGRRDGPTVLPAQPTTRGFPPLPRRV
ncbi:hypothetical protein ASA1KI_27060 [Opitutales bacterium ASA1]|nr:hypothetical protein ASA1KI_27060 [Opitutales bacterium ASA1]